MTHTHTHTHTFFPLCTIHLLYVPGSLNITVTVSGLWTCSIPGLSLGLERHVILVLFITSTVLNTSVNSSHCSCGFDGGRKQFSY